MGSYIEHKPGFLLLNLVLCVEVWIKCKIPALRRIIIDYLGEGFLGTNMVPIAARKACFAIAAASVLKTGGDSLQDALNMRTIIDLDAQNAAAGRP